VLPYHPDLGGTVAGLPGQIWTNWSEAGGAPGMDDDGNGYVDDVHGWNFVDDSNDLTDRWGHGTLVAGIIAAKRDNEVGIAGINPGARIMVLKVSDDTHRPNTLGMYRAIHYAVDHGARVLNLSMGAPARSRLVQLAVNYAHLRGAVVVVATGNTNADVHDYAPAGLRRVLAVGALGFEGQRHALSNFGANTGLLAPGEDIYSLHSQQAEWTGPSAERDRMYRAATGTSFAAPIVAATASLLFAADPKRTNREVEALLLATAKDLDQPGWDPMTGYGLLDAKAALSGDAKRAVVVFPTEVLISRAGKKKVSAVDVYGVVAGASSYEVSVGEGRNPSEWTPIARGDRPIQFGLIGHVDGERFKGAKEWTIRITATGADGTRRVADVPVSL
ncbi:MAG: S8 family serine peptidase, partial [Gemmatimonadales bacterium]|nr:S8 family serine peptidase [Gemmatimonadales bacterium]